MLGMGFAKGKLLGLLVGGGGVSPKGIGEYIGEYNVHKIRKAFLEH